jgi:hypothetical protein
LCDIGVLAIYNLAEVTKILSADFVSDTSQTENESSGG